MNTIVREVHVCGACGGRNSPTATICQYCGNYFVPLSQIPTRELKAWKPNPQAFISDDSLVENLYDGESGYTVYWALSISNGKVVGINKDYHIKPKKGGTANVLVTRSGSFVVVQLTERIEISRISWPADSILPAMLTEASKHLLTIQPLISELREGQGGYTVPWALDGRKHIDGKFSVSSRSGGTCQLHVEMKNGHIVVRPLDTDFRHGLIGGIRFKVSIS